MHPFDLIRWVVSLEGDNLIVFYYFSTSVVADYCLTPHNFSGISWREHVPFQDDDDVRFVLDQQTET